MPLSLPDRRRIGAKASWLRERLAGDYLPDPQADARHGDALWQRWQEMLGTTLEARLRLEGWHDRDLRPWLAGVVAAPAAADPSWLASLDTLITVTESPDTALPVVPAFWLPGRPVPFEPLHVPAVAWALATLRERVGSTWEGLSDQAAGAQGHALLTQLASLSEGCLARTLAATRPSDPAAPPMAVSEAFVRALRQGGLATFYGLYPVLGRLVARTVEQWLDTGTVFLQRLATDRDAIAARFGGDPGPVADLRPYRSDRHLGGQSVHEVRFASGLTLAYKPKPVGADSRYADLIAWIADHDPPESLTAVPTLDRADYGWQVWLPSRPIGDRERFFRRCGALLDLIHALGGVDVGRDNVIVAGDDPVPIDLETLWHPRLATAPDPRHDSVWRTGLLPDGPDHQADSALGDVSFLGPLAAAIPEAREAVVSGLCAMQAWRRRWQEPLRHWLETQATPPLRFIARPTHVYTDLLRRTMQPTNLQDGAKFSMALEALATDRPDLLPLLPSEQAALGELDVPLFRHDAHARHLHLPDGTVLRNFFPASGQAQSLARWSRPPEDDVAVTRTCLPSG